jgi:chromosome segregation ATPase
MSSGFMGKKVNLFLLLMLMLILLGFGGVTVYYQYTFRNINQKYDNVSANLGTCEQNLSQTTTSFMTAMKNLNSTETDIKKYDVLYEQKAGELEQKKTDLSNTQAELTRVTLLKESYKKQIDQAYAQIIGLNQTITSLNIQITVLNRNIAKLNDRVTCQKNTDDGQESSCLS